MKQSMAEMRRVIEKQVALRYIEYLPDGYRPADDEAGDEGAGLPLVIFLHGAGERGDDLEKVNATGLSKLAATDDEFPFVLICPQCPHDSWWPVLGDEFEALLRHCIDTYHVDTSRIYLTGLSIGGYGTWHFAVANPHAFAAIAPICGGGDWWRGFPEKVRSITHVPVWAFHGDQDETVPPEKSSELVDELKAAGATDVKLTIYPAVGHDSWTAAYNDPKLYEWMLSKRNDEFAF